MRALQELTAALAEVGVKPRVLEDSQLGDRQLAENLILIGSNDTNLVTAEVLQRIGCSFSVGSQPLALLDGYTGEYLEPVWSSKSSGGRQLMTDFGIVVRSTNPFSPRRGVVVIAGVYGFATLAGVRLLQDDDFLRRIADLQQVECSFRVDLVSEVHARTTLLQVRQLPQLDLVQAWVSRNAPAENPSEAGEPA